MRTHCEDCGEPFELPSVRRVCCPPCKAARKRLAEKQPRENALTRTQYEIVCKQMAAAREAACAAETPGEVEFYTRKWEALELVTRPYANGTRPFADGKRAGAALMAMG